MTYTQAPFDRWADGRSFGRQRSMEWKQFRAGIIKAQPTCIICGGCESLEAHHLKPFHLFPELEMEETNIAVLCDKPGRCCHFVWGHFYNWRTYNPKLHIAVAFWKVHRRGKKP